MGRAACRLTTGIHAFGKVFLQALVVQFTLQDNHFFPKIVRNDLVRFTPGANFSRRAVARRLVETQDLHYTIASRTRARINRFPQGNVSVSKNSRSFWHVVLLTPRRESGG